MNFHKALCLFTTAAVMTASLIGCGSADPAEQAASSALAGESGSTAVSAETTEAAQTAATAEAAASNISATETPAEEASTQASSDTGTTENAAEAETDAVKNMETSTGDTAVETVESTQNLRVTNKNGGQINIAVFGDSQFDNYRGENGIAYLLSYYLDANVYNMAMGGTTASVGEQYKYNSFDDWNERDFWGMANAAVGNITDTSFFEGYSAHDAFEQCDFDKVDYFIIEYGVNDFILHHPRLSDNDPTVYQGALLRGINLLKDKYPNAQIIVCAPTYVHMWYNVGGGYWIDGYITDNGYGTLYDFMTAAQEVADKTGSMQITPWTYWNMQEGNFKEYLVDGIHMNDTARRKYAQILSRIILRTSGYDVPSETDLDTLDYSTLVKQN